MRSSEVVTASRYTPFEELTHAYSHGIGVLLSLGALISLLWVSVKFGGAWEITSSIFYGASLIALYLSSTLYHAVTHVQKKASLRKLDHAIIYVMIAGSYTPITLISLRHDYGWAIFSAVWALAFLGLYLEIIAKNAYRKTAIALYLIMGWLIIAAIKPLVANVPAQGITLILAGGICYTVGVVFYRLKKMPYHHFIWHLFVLAGSIFHFIAYWLYIFPRGISA